MVSGITSPSRGASCGAAALALCTLFACAAPRELGRAPDEGPGLSRLAYARLPGLGRLTQLAVEPDGSVWAVGRRGAVRIAPGGAMRRVAAFAGRVAPRRVAAVPTKAGIPVFVDRGGEGSRVAFYGPGGREEWTLRARSLAAGDLEGDGALDLVVGLEGRGGLRRLDREGRPIWTRAAVDPRWVELLDVEGDGRLEILHTRLGDALVLRDFEGRVVRRLALDFRAAHSLGHFAVLKGAGRAASPRVALRVEGRLRLIDLEGRVVAELPAPIWNAEGTFEVVRFAPAGAVESWLALLDLPGDAAPAVLAVWDAAGRRVHDQVMDASCGALSPAPDGRALLVGCGETVWRYGSGVGTGRAGPSVAAWRRRGDLFGPLRAGMTPAEVRGARALLPGHRCRGPICGLSYVRAGGHDFVLSTRFVGGTLAGVLLVGLPEPAEAYGRATREAWQSLAEHLAAGLGPPAAPPGPYPSPGEVRAAPERGDWRARATHRWSGGGREVELGVLTLDAEGPVQFAPYARIVPGPSGHGVDSGLPASAE